jgi:flagellar basal body-associated protein FliL
MSSTTANPELHAFQVAVRDKIVSVGSQYGYSHITNQVIADLGLDNLVEDVVVTVRVTLPAADQADANALVASQVSSVYLPAGWSAEVAA